MLGAQLKAIFLPGEAGTDTVEEEEEAAPPCCLRCGTSRPEGGGGATSAARHPAATARERRELMVLPPVTLARETSMVRDVASLLPLALFNEELPPAPGRAAPPPCLLDAFLGLGAAAAS